jgi:formylglycine-generating enzyme required for sulfatase activity
MNGRNELKFLEEIKKMLNGLISSLNKRRLLLSVFCLLSSVFCLLSSAYANNIQVSNAQLSGMGEETTYIQFDISWENSWRFSNSYYDAAWVFAKWTTYDNTTKKEARPYKPATIVNYSLASASGTGLSVILPTDNYRGVFLFRSADANGTLSTTSIKLQWDPTGDGVPSGSNVIVKVFAIEMAYITQGAFYLGDGTARTGATSSHFFDASSSAGSAVRISSSAPYISDVSTGSGTAGDIAWVNESGEAGDLPASRTQISSSFPTGYNAFYIMKYEVTQGQYRDFLNTLTRTQQATRVGTTIAGQTSVANIFVMSNSASVTNRNGIRCNPTIPSTDPVYFYCDLNNNALPNESTDGEWLACNWLNWVDLCAYADWAGLRPMTELEFEKAARGPAAAVAGEYAWGTTNITQATGISNSGAINEIASNSGANCVYGSATNVQGPLRTGFAATSTTTTREQTGASFYGIMELSGNLWERPVSVMGSQSGTAVSTFAGTNGDGTLAADGNASGTAGVNIYDWPGYASGEVTGAAGSGCRGGIWSDDSSYGRTSARSNAATAYTGRNNNYGGRLARTSP